MLFIVLKPIEKDKLKHTPGGTVIDINRLSNSFIHVLAGYRDIRVVIKH